MERPHRAQETRFPCTCPPFSHITALTNRLPQLRERTLFQDPEHIRTRISEGSVSWFWFTPIARAFQDVTAEDGFKRIVVDAEHIVVGEKGKSEELRARPDASILIPLPVLGEDTTADVDSRCIHMVMYEAWTGPLYCDVNRDKLMDSLRPFSVSQSINPIEILSILQCMIPTGPTHCWIRLHHSFHRMSLHLAATEPTSFNGSVDCSRALSVAIPNTKTS